MFRHRRRKTDQPSQPPPPEVAVRIENVWKVLGQQPVLQGIQLDIRQGSTTVIMGPSGCGKSVLLKHIIGLMTPDEGNVWVFGQNVPTLTRQELIRLRQRMGVLFQSAALFDSLTVEENVAFMLRQHRPEMSQDEVEAAVAEALEMVQLPGIQRLKPAELSGGMRKRVGLARAIVMRPDLILYDEPTTGLDPITARGINRLIRELDETLGKTSIVVTHDIESALYVGDWIAMMHRGTIVVEGKPDEVVRSDHPLAREFFAEPLVTFSRRSSQQSAPDGSPPG